MIFSLSWAVTVPASIYVFMEVDCGVNLVESILTNASVWVGGLGGGGWWVEKRVGFPTDTYEKGRMNSV
jgi:hypothetical protein